MLDEEEVVQHVSPEQFSFSDHIDNFDADHINFDDDNDDDDDGDIDKNLRQVWWSSDNRHCKPLLRVEVGGKLPHLSSSSSLWW